MTQKRPLRQFEQVHRFLTATPFVLTLGFVLITAAAAAEALERPEMKLSHALVIRSVARSGRSAVHLDPVEAEVVKGTWRPPQAGELGFESADRGERWETATVSEEGVLKRGSARGGYICWPVRSDRGRVMLLEAAGYNCVYVNGEIRAGDTYGFGYLQLPVWLREGTNHFLFQAGRGEFKAKLSSPPALLAINSADSTLPDFVVGETEAVWGAAVLVNMTTNFMQGFVRAVEFPGPEQVVTIPPLGIYKAPFVLNPPRVLPTNGCAVTLEPVSVSAQSAIGQVQVKVRTRRSDETHVRTFISDMDGSVQYYAVNPSPARPEGARQPALFLSLHGAGVEARGQAEAYAPKRWGHIICPTNRRPYGFDWEEWGRWDALEVLQLARQRYRTDPSRTYLTGHSMGGHGTWQLGVLFPDQFAAIGPSAGWISFTSYAARDAAPATNALQNMLRRAAAASDTLVMATNFLQEGIYILHGDADDNVPITQARQMREHLGPFHHDVTVHEQPGAGHWWDASDEPGAECVDWPPMFDLFARRVIPAGESLRRIRFVTVNPAVSSGAHWVRVLAQERSLAPSVVDAQCDPGKRRVVGRTANVSRLWLEFPGLEPGPGLTVELDGQKLEGLAVPDRSESKEGTHANTPWTRGLGFAFQEGQWRLAGELPLDHKRPERSGPFREAFRRHMVLVYATRGTPEENAWTLAKARYDAETFYYRGNASIELVPDVEVAAQDWSSQRLARNQPSSCNLILYGHAECNAAWWPLLRHSPVQVHRGQMRVGDRAWTGDDLACLFLQPHPRDPAALVGVVAGTGLPGLRVTERMPYFLSGAGFPDCLVFGAELPAEGIQGVRAAGFFGQDWQVATGEFVWKE